ncbi:MAG: lytic murein transglycosylase [Chitinophagaceae bacterium]|nr:lytic murein transglycosylase [Rubrivivax sp.]
MHSITSPQPRRPRLALAALACSLLAGCASSPVTRPPSPAPAPRSVQVTQTATAEASLQPSFAAWVANFAATARTAGIGEETLRAAFSEVRYLPRVVELDRAQPEFTRTVWDYLDRTVTPLRIAMGQNKLSQVRGEADAAAARYGVPPEIVVAIWGMESSYGVNTGDISTIEALATLGFDGRREDWARGQLLAALKILQTGDIDRTHMMGSWAGAMGQTQFLPSSFLAYAVDADGDGRRDIWNSMADVMASTANFLARSGWQADQSWGVEVRLPPGFDAGRADPSVRQPANQWAAEGVQAIDGTSLPHLADAMVLLPAGASGPAFLVSANFRAILKYNNSTSYALAVSLLAQGLAGGPGVQAAWPRSLQTLDRGQMLALQTALNERGFASGTPDGMMGPATRSALRRFQRSLGLAADGYPTLGLLQRLQER